MHLPKHGAVFEGKVEVPWGEKVAYKFIVDGRWTTRDDQPTEFDHDGNLNNVYNAPVMPPLPKVEEVQAPEPVRETPHPKDEPEVSIATTTPTDHAIGTVNGVIGSVTDAAKNIAEAIAPEAAITLSPVVNSADPETAAEEPSKVAETRLETVAEPQVVEVPSTAEVVEEPSGTTTEAAEAPAPQAPDVTLNNEVSRDEVLLASPSVQVAPIVPVPILPLILSEEVNGGVAPETPFALPEAEAEVEVAALRSLETTIVEGVATAETATGPAPPPKDEASTHVPATNGATATNGVETNGASHPPAPALPAPITTSSASSPSSTMKRMRFPSIGSRRSSTYSSSTNELGEINGKHDAGSLKRSVTKRNSFFGKLKGIFHHHDSPAAAVATANAQQKS